MKDRYFKYLAITIIAGVILAIVNPTHVEAKPARAQGVTATAAATAASTKS